MIHLYLDKDGCQQLPGVQKFIFDNKIGIPIPTNITFDIIFFVYLAAAGSHPNPGMKVTYPKNDHLYQIICLLGWKFQFCHQK